MLTAPLELDRPPGLFPHGLADHDERARTFEPFVAAGLPDAEAWEALFSDAERIARYRAVYGNRKGRRRG